ncbi:hypothetical protein C0992_000956 [Termitomyces sp. T32_za158]|nr:hypothetical protein C0992_000956 [Termitomyces sp. T32_za158]
MNNDPSPSEPSSPRSSHLPSSPSSDSVSSLPSVSSSFFFSSAAASPPHPHSEPEHLAKDSTHGLVIPSLTLPPALRKPTPYGQTLGDLRLLVLGKKDAGKSFISQLLLEENEEVVEVGAWEDSDDGRILRASTDWLEHRDAHGLETFEPTRNVEIVELSGYDSASNIPIILLPRPSNANQNARISSFRPSSIVALRAGLFRSPETISLLRSEATDRFLRWREVERSVDDIHMAQRNDTSYHHRDPDGMPWCKAKWEAEWLPSLSQDVAKRLREGTVTERGTRRRSKSKNHDHVRFDDSPHLCINNTRYDPLYFPSLVMFSVSLLGPLRTRMRRALARITEIASDTHIRVAILSGFTIGVGVGLFLKSGSA